ncbi:holo-ACP synthase [Buchnera aphidicola]|uniref:holo-ACP synthase n=1 Tax=Buchnera aphidicola TaxID=9 RepID=UPI0031B85C84
MSIIGIGIDILQKKRIKKIFNKFKKKFVIKILSNYELNQFFQEKEKINFLAKRFSIKESISKAIGTGIRKEIKFKNIELHHNKYGKPIIIFLNETKKIIKILKIKFTHISITDEKKYVCTVVILER